MELYIKPQRDNPFSNATATACCGIHTHPITREGQRAMR